MFTKFRSHYFIYLTSMTFSEDFNETIQFPGSNTKSYIEPPLPTVTKEGSVFFGKITSLV